MRKKSSESTLGIDLYRKMYLARMAEEKIREHYLEDEMKTPMHMSMGEEAIAIGVSHALRPADQIFATYRSHALFLARTGKVEDFFAEMYGKDTALLKGKGGSMHLCAPEFGFMGSSAIVASNIPVGLGAAFAKKREGSGGIAAIFFGDGAADEGTFWESLNVACLMKLPVLFVCEDNGLAVHTPTPLRQGYGSITEVVSKFNCTLLSSSTTDVESIYDLACQAIGSIIDKKIPCFMHLKYYRYLEHVGVNEDFAAGYRSKQEFEEWLQVDPVKLQRQRLLGQGISQAALTKIEREIDSRIEGSLDLAKEAPFAKDSELNRNVFAE